MNGLMTVFTVFHFDSVLGIGVALLGSVNIL